MSSEEGCLCLLLVASQRRGGLTHYREIPMNLNFSGGVSLKLLISAIYDDPEMMKQCETDFQAARERTYTMEEWVEVFQKVKKKRDDGFRKQVEEGSDLAVYNMQQALRRKYPEEAKAKLPPDPWEAERERRRNYKGAWTCDVCRICGEASRADCYCDLVRRYPDHPESLTYMFAHGMTPAIKKGKVLCGKCRHARCSGRCWIPDPPRGLYGGPCPRCGSSEGCTCVRAL